MDIIFFCPPASPSVLTGLSYFLLTHQGRRVGRKSPVITSGCDLTLVCVKLGFPCRLAKQYATVFDTSNMAKVCFSIGYALAKISSCVLLVLFARPPNSCPHGASNIGICILRRTLSMLSGTLVNLLDSAHSHRTKYSLAHKVDRLILRLALKVDKYLSSFMSVFITSI